MREANFVDQNKQKWLEFEELLNQKKKDPDRLTRLLIEVSDDLSYAQSNYPNRSVRFYLNALAQRVFNTIIQARRSPAKRLVTFWTVELPAIVYHARREMLISLLVFAAAMLIGIFSTEQDPNFPRQILGDDYVDMTLNNIEKGDPMAVYKQQKELPMFLGIAWNNFLVSMRTFFSGILFGIGTLVVLLYNGIMVGSFQYFFFEQSVGPESVLTIWQHGTLEISAIIIAGGAGLTLPHGLLFPGTYSRGQALRQSAKRGLKIFLGVAPVILLAALIEGFITRQTDYPTAIRVAVILFSLAFVVAYFVVYPWLMPARLKQPYRFERQAPPSVPYAFDPDRLRNVGPMFAETFRLLRFGFLRMMWPVLLATGVTLFLTYFAVRWLGLPAADFYDAGVRAFLRLLWLEHYPAHYVAVTFFFGILGIGVSRIVCRAMDLPLEKRGLLHYVQFFLVAAVFSLVFFIGNGWGVFLTILNLPLLLLSTVIVRMEKRNFLSALGKSLTLIGANFWRALWLYLVVLIIGLFMLSLSISTPVDMIIEFFSWNLPFSDDVRTEVLTITVTLRMLLGLGITYSFWVSAFFILYHSLVEAYTARGLLRKLDRLIPASTDEPDTDPTFG